VWSDDTGSDYMPISNLGTSAKPHWYNCIHSTQTPDNLNVVYLDADMRTAFRQQQRYSASTELGKCQLYTKLRRHVTASIIEEIEVSRSITLNSENINTGH
jgi:hypothetical protein